MVAQLVALYVNFKLDESYTPSKISIRAGDGFHNLKVTLFAARDRFKNECSEACRIYMLIVWSEIAVRCPVRAGMYL